LTNKSSLDIINISNEREVKVMTEERYEKFESLDELLDWFFDGLDDEDKNEEVNNYDF
jgi:hypothetical protein